MKYLVFLSYVDKAKDKDSATDFLNEYGGPYDAETMVVWARIIFAAAHNDWKGLVQAAREKFAVLKQSSSFARFFGIPYKSLRNWIDGIRKPPSYIIRLVGFSIVNNLPTEGNQTAAMYKMVK